MSDDAAHLIPRTDCFKVGLQSALCLVSLGNDFFYVSGLPLIYVIARPNQGIRHLHIALYLRKGHPILLFRLYFAPVDQLELGDIFKYLIHCLQVVFSYGRHLLAVSLCLVGFLAERSAGHHRVSPSFPGLYLALELSELPLFLLAPLLCHQEVVAFDVVLRALLLEPLVELLRQVPLILSNRYRRGGHLPCP